MTSYRLARRGALIALVAAPLSLALRGPLATAPALAAAPAPVWTVNQAASRLGFRSSMGGTGFEGQFTRWRAIVRFDPANLAGSSVTVKVDLASARTGSADRDEALPTQDWFAAARSGPATYTAASFRDLGNSRYQAAGTLSLRGVSRPLPLIFQLRIAGRQARMIGNATIDRHAFGVGQGQFATPDSIPFAVQVVVSLNATRA